jgi:hypothetical protein
MNEQLKYCYSLLIVTVIVFSGICPQVAEASEQSSCTSIADDKTRLSCYDEMNAKAKQEKSSAPEKLPTDPANKAESQVSQLEFGKETLPTKKQAEPASDEIDTISARVSGIAKRYGGLFSIELENGQVWMETSRTGGLPPSIGDEVTVKRGALGGYFLSGKAGLGLRVRRLR